MNYRNKFRSENSSIMELLHYYMITTYYYYIFLISISISISIVVIVVMKYVYA